MPHPRRFRFGIQLTSATGGAEWASLAREAEDLGYSTLFLPDHFGDQLAPVPALMAAADATTHLRIGSLVLDNDYKHPVVTAKELASLDVLSDGRLELGIGAGWMASDYEQAGIPMDAAAERIDRLEEALAVLKGLFAPGPFDFTGKHYTIRGLDGLPKPRQEPHPPFLIGGGGPRVLRLAAREADIVGINPAIRSGRVDGAAARDGSAAVTDRKLAWVREAAGDRYADLEINMLVFVCTVTDDRAGTLEATAPLFGMSPDDVAVYPHAWVGSAEEIADDLRAARERWDASYLVVQGAETMRAAAPVVALLAGT
ncbi:MAG TPA: TIGR03621 family F420-dependent LLM class oxidoreductase [Acidimicrobiales bacterium]|nr:TIGR03621 family F420-dependent LLM class oxidoreductase [Acidimicrobiales bacterium]